MTRDEWYKTQLSVKLRFLNNIAASIQHKTQEFNDVLELILMEKPDLTAFDKFTLVHMQKHIVHLEAQKLWDRVRDLVRMIEPHEFDDMKPPKSSCTEEQKPLGGFENEDSDDWK